jgi:hypothetical protein
MISKDYEVFSTLHPYVHLELVNNQDEYIAFLTKYETNSLKGEKYGIINCSNSDFAIDIMWHSPRSHQVTRRKEKRKNWIWN